MEKSRILITCSVQTLRLGEKLRDELQTDYCEAFLWSEEGTSQTSSTISEMLENATEQFDFAVLLIARNDIVTRGSRNAPARKASDNCVFEAGLFTAAIGRIRCFLVHSVKESDLPSALAGITCMRFEEPRNLNDGKKCAEAIASVASDLKEIVRLQGRAPYRLRVPAYSSAELWRRERPRSDGGDLRTGDVVVCDTQPMADEELAVQLRRNLECGIKYYYFLYFSPDTIEKIFQSLQVVLAAGIGSAAQATDFNARESMMETEQHRILADLERICNERRLRITLMTDEPQFAFRVHNASNSHLARVYVKFAERWFIPWAEGSRAESLWRSLPKWVEDEGPNRLFVPLKIGLDSERKKLFERGLDQALDRYFPGIEDKVRQICTGTRS
jgi:hypothetical protein